jgi:hypothetical protein
MQKRNCAVALIVACAIFGPTRLVQAQANIGVDPSLDSMSPKNADVAATTRPDLQPDLDTLTKTLNSTAITATLDDPLYACACGCGIFDVGTASMLPPGQGGMVWLEYAFQDQNINWSGSSRAPAVDNNDKEIRTSFITAGLQYMFSRQWGIQVEVPTAYRYFQTTGGATGSDIVTNTWAALGDVRVEGIYTGFFPDLSAGIDFGFKLPTGDYTHNDAFGDIDRDSEIGTGSLDALLGGFYRLNLTADNRWTAFTQALLDIPFLGRDQYLPGAELDGAVGVYYTGLHLGSVGIVPIGQLLYSYRLEDSGNEASSPVASGYTRLLLSPGLELNIHPFMIYLDAEFPVYEHVNGDQLVAPVLLKCLISYQF